VVAEPTTIEERKHDRVTLVPGRLPTVSLTGDDATVSPAASVTWSSKLQFPAVVKVPVEIEGFEEVVHPIVKEPPRVTKVAFMGDSWSH